MKHKYSKTLISILILMIICIPKVSAETCDPEDIERLKTIANHIDLSYEINKYIDYEAEVYEEDVQEFYGYKFLFSNMSADFYINGSLTNNAEYKYESENIDAEGHLIRERLQGGEYNIDIYSTNCSTKLRTISITLPYYNKYYEDEICTNYKDKIEECKEWTDTEMYEETIKEAIETYNEQNKEEEKNNTTINKILLIITTILILLIIIISVIIIKKKRSELI